MPVSASVAAVVTWMLVEVVHALPTSVDAVATGGVVSTRTLADMTVDQVPEPSCHWT